MSRGPLAVWGRVDGAPSLSRKLREWHAASGKEWPQVLRIEARNISASLARSTQPFGEGEDAHQQGMAAVERDIRKVYGSGGDAWASIHEKDAQLASAFYYFFELPNARKAGEILASSGARMRNVPIAAFDGGEAHRSSRNRRGRVSRRVPALIVKAFSRVDSYITRKKRLVGFAKSAWAGICRQLGSVAMLPLWIKRNKAPGTVIDRSRDPRNPSIQIRSDLDYAGTVLSQKNIQLAMNAAEGRLEKMTDIALEKSRQKARL